MPTLNDYRKAAGYATIKAFASAMQCSSSKASMVLQGRYLSTLSDDELRQIATILKIDTMTVWSAMNESYRQWHASWYDPVKHDSPAMPEVKPRSPLDILIDRACGLE